MAPAKHSGLQKQALELYRACLRAARNQKTPEARREAASFIRTEFRRHATEVKKTDFQRIEFLLRQGQKKLKVLAHADVTGFSVAPSAGSAGSRTASER